MKGRLEGKVIIITGSTRGIGRGIALAVAKEGAKVVVSGRNESEGRKVIEEIHNLGGDGIFVRTDITNISDCKSLIEQAEIHFGKLDGLVNNAGIFPRASLLETEENLFDEVFTVNVKGAFFCTKYAIEAMIRNNGGSIVNIGSTHAFNGGFKLAAYSCSKGALHTLTLHVARNYAKYHIRANWITVGWVITPGELEVTYKEGYDEEWLKLKGEERIPMGRFQTPEDIAMGTIYLLSDESDQVTGSELHITGGFLP
jgi:NAD(P)-dependent dehydrogenase (short-subunit alcohol dehydrogenase family)